ncbi:hypothetical protein Hte_010991 [Hypoxylon texense]
MASTPVHDTQPGLEVIPRDSDLEVTYPHQQWLYPVLGGQDEHKQSAPQAGTTAEEPQAGAVAGGSNPPRKIITRKTILLALACVLVVAGVVVGAVVGTQRSRSSSPTTTTPPSPSQPESGQDNSTSMSSPAEMTGSPTSVSPGLAPTAVSWGYPHLEIFALTNNKTNSLYRKYRNINATSESKSEFLPEGYDMEYIGGNIDANSAPSVAVNHRRETPTNNQTEVFINAEGSCYNNWHVNSQGWIWWGPVFPGLSVIGAPVVVRYNASVELVQVFSLGAADTSRAVYYTKWHVRENEYTDPAQIPGPDLQDMKPAVIAWNGDDSRVDLFVVSQADNHLRHASWSTATGSWSEYEDLQGFATTPPVVVSRGPGSLDVFIRGGDAGLWYLSYDNTNKTWTGWTRISGDSRIHGQPDAVAATPDTVDVFAWREDGQLLHKSLDGNSGHWTPEEDFEVLADGEIISGPPNAVSDGPGSIHVFAYRNEKELMWMRLNSGSVGQGTNTATLANVPYL